MITSASNERIKQIAALQSKPGERRKTGLFVMEGSKLFEEAPPSLIREVYVTGSFLKKLEKDRDAYLREKLEKIGYEEISENLFSKLSDTRTPQGILAVGKQREYRLEELLGEKPLLLLLESIQDPGNLGTILRTAEGAGITGVVMNRETVDVYNPKVIRSTMGSIYRVPFLYTENLKETIENLQKQGIRVFAAHLSGEKYYDEEDYREGTAFLIGNEGNGLRQETAGMADGYIKIPMKGKLESLNAGVASALLMYEAARQRRKKD